MTDMKYETRDAIDDELHRLRKATTGPVCLMDSLYQTAAYLNRELTEHGNGPRSRREALEVAAIAIRIIEEGDADFKAASAGR